MARQGFAAHFGGVSARGIRSRLRGDAPKYGSALIRKIAKIRRAEGQKTRERGAARIRALAPGR